MADFPICGFAEVEVGLGLPNLTCTLHGSPEVAVMQTQW